MLQQEQNSNPELACGAGRRWILLQIPLQMQQTMSAKVGARVSLLHPATCKLPVIAGERVRKSKPVALVACFPSFLGRKGSGPPAEPADAGCGVSALSHPFARIPLRASRMCGRASRAFCEERHRSRFLPKNGSAQRNRGNAPLGLAAASRSPGYPRLRFPLTRHDPGPANEPLNTVRRTNNFWARFVPFPPGRRRLCLRWR
jgi:hypothetical protein